MVRISRVSVAAIALVCATACQAGIETELQETLDEYVNKTPLCLPEQYPFVSDPSAPMASAPRFIEQKKRLEHLVRANVLTTRQFKMAKYEGANEEVFTVYENSALDQYRHNMGYAATHFHGRYEKALGRGADVSYVCIGKFKANAIDEYEGPTKSGQAEVVKVYFTYDIVDKAPWFEGLPVSSGVSNFLKKANSEELYAILSRTNRGWRVIRMDPNFAVVQKPFSQ